jgi:hypothetical protein
MSKIKGKQFSNEVFLHSENPSGEENPAPYSKMALPKKIKRSLK